MEINIAAIIVTCTLAALAWYVNETLNPVPVLKTVIRVVIVVTAVLLFLQNCGLMGSNVHVRVA